MALVLFCAWGRPLTQVKNSSFSCICRSACLRFTHCYTAGLLPSLGGEAPRSLRINVNDLYKILLVKISPVSRPSG